MSKTEKLLQVYKEREEEFDDSLDGYLILTDGDITLEKPRNRIKDFNRQTLIAMAEADIEVMEGMKRHTDNIEGPSVVVATVRGNEDGRNAALDDLIAIKRAFIKSLREDE